MAEWATTARHALAREPVALVTILATEGSAPRSAGTRMVVTAAGARGTIGGGALEHRAIEQARAMLGQPAGDWRIQDYPLGPLLGQCCGGRVRLLVERLDPLAADWLDDAGRAIAATLHDDRIVRVIADDTTPILTARGERPAAGASFAEAADIARRPLLLFGAGHVGRAIARAAERLPFALAWFDTRPEQAERAGVVLLDEAAIIACAGDAPEGSAVLILTHDHGLDYRLTVAALTSPARFVGLIGSRTKRARFLSRLQKDGVDAARLTCPVGVAGITGKEPAVIAVSVAAQLLQLQSEMPSAASGQCADRQFSMGRSS